MALSGQKARASVIPNTNEPRGPFRLMIPLSISSNVGAMVPLVFGLAASIPVVIMAWLMHKAVNGAARLSHGFEHFQQWLNGVTGVLFILIAILLLMEE